MSELISNLSVRLADAEKQYMADKEAARKAKQERLVAIAEDYFAEAEGANVEEFAEVLGKSVAYATALAKEAGFSQPGTGKRGRPSKFAESEQKIIAEKFALAKDSFGQMEIALEHRVAPETIKGWAVKHGFLTVKKREKATA